MSNSDLRGWIALIIVAAGGFTGSWMAYDQGAAVTTYRVKELERCKKEMQSDLKDTRERLIKIESLIGQGG